MPCLVALVALPILTTMAVFDHEIRLRGIGSAIARIALPKVNCLTRRNLRRRGASDATERDSPHRLERLAAAADGEIPTESRPIRVALLLVQKLFVAKKQFLAKLCLATLLLRKRMGVEVDKPGANLLEVFLSEQAGEVIQAFSNGSQWGIGIAGPLALEDDKATVWKHTHEIGTATSFLSLC